MRRASTASARRDAPPGEATADRLLATAAQLFRRKGYAQSSTRELADLLGIQKASLYYHIRTKEDLLHAICLASLSHIIEEVSAVAREHPAEERLRAVIVAHVVSAIRDRDMHATMLMELRALSQERLAEVVERRDAYETLLRDVIVADQEASRVRSDVSAKYLTLALLNVLNWTIFWFDPDGGLSSDELGKVLATVFIEGAQGGALPV
jgi:AcrR family transcriptional regulator